MKTKILIKLLQEVDPTGEEEVCVNNADIISVDPMPAYYDGPLQVLDRDESRADYNIVGAKFVRHGTKIQITPYSIDDAIWENPDINVDCVGNKYLEDRVEKVREKVKTVNEELGIKE